jgi:hypothetical protein
MRRDHDVNHFGAALRAQGGPSLGARFGHADTCLPNFKFPVNWYRVYRKFSIGEIGSRVSKAKSGTRMSPAHSI